MKVQAQGEIKEVFLEKERIFGSRAKASLFGRLGEGWEMGYWGCYSRGGLDEGERDEINYRRQTGKKPSGRRQLLSDHYA